METALPLEQVRANVERALREQAERYARPALRRSRGRPLSPQTRARIGRRRFEQTRREALANGATPLKRRRLEVGLSQRELARKAELSVRSIQRAEQDPAEVSAKTLARLALALDADAREIV